MMDALVDQYESEETQERTARAGWIMGLRTAGVLDRNVLKALENVPRKLFLNASQQRYLYEDRAFPIDCGQMSTAPSTIGKTAAFLKLGNNHSLLEIGTGSGYQTAVLSCIAGSILSMERYKSLVLLARDRVDACKLSNVKIVQGDGLSQMPSFEDDDTIYDRILLNGAVERVPDFLFGRLSYGGRLIAPIKDEEHMCSLIAYEKEGENLQEEHLGKFRFISLTPGTAVKL
ncbi:protein-L-isoaspartate O-methyltransferase family protein [Flexibacterium corallicola]|uniref:protein-L-isoaspartate O-methyltransferase family protein n=1 Tax=Flexibacterium corallicola TaxID=3037259 RepID=UPI00286F73E4|nr:protein-L-isoaspartate O-methyltransferase [Pseudovibrio sp. M1P-2-3]